MSDAATEQTRNPLLFELDIHRGETVESIEDAYDAGREFINHVATEIIESEGQPVWDELVAALIDSRPSNSWFQRMVIARQASRSLHGKSESLSTDDAYNQAGVLLASEDVVLSTAFVASSEAEKKEAYRSSVDILLGLLDIESNDLNFEEHQAAVIQNTIFLAAYLPSVKGSSQHARNLVNELRAGLNAKKPLTEEDYAGYSLMHNRLNEENITLQQSVDTVAYIVEGLDEDALLAMKLYFSDIMLYELENYLLSYAEDRTYRERMIKSWRTIHEIVGRQAFDHEDESLDSGTSLEPVALEEFKPLEVKWEVLPPGDLLDHAKEIIEGMEEAGRNQNGYIPPVIDPSRLKSLEEIRELWGADSAYYMKGALKQRRKVRDDKRECPDQYIVLILQDEDKDGNIIEHAVAESPIAGPHALYVYRQDVNPDVSWREVMSRSKADARQLGARPVKHPSGLGSDELVATMSERVSALLTVNTEEFLRVEFNGQRIRINKNIAIKAFAGLVIPTDV